GAAAGGAWVAGPAGRSGAVGVRGSVRLRGWVPPEWVLSGFCIARPPPMRLSEPVPLTTPLKPVAPKALALATIWLLPVSVIGPARKMRVVEFWNVTTLLLKRIGLARAKKVNWPVVVGPPVLARIPEVRTTGPLLRALTLLSVSVPVVPMPL